MKKVENLKQEADFQDAKVVKGTRMNIGKYYNDAFSKYTYEKKKNLIGDVRQKQVLDLGCGKGEATIEALKEGAYVTAIDISPRSIELVYQKAQEIGLEKHLKAFVMDAHHLEFGDEIFDLVIGNGILHHLPDLEGALSEVRRVLKKDGYAVFLEPLGMNPILKLYRVFTPSMRTKDEQPFRMRELNIIKEVFPGTKFMFFDLTTLIGKIFLALNQYGFVEKNREFFLKTDDALLRNGKEKITIFKKMAWIVLLEMRR